MNSTQIHAALVNIANHPGKLDKQRLVGEGLADAEFKRVIIAALDPFTTYGIAKLPQGATTGGQDFNDRTWLLLSDLASRTRTGNDARSAVESELCSLNEASGTLLGWIITKDLHAGFGESTVNKACKGTIKDFPYQRCSLPKDAKFGTWDWAAGVISQEKADGMFCNTNFEAGGVVTLTTRQGNPFPMDRFERLEAGIKRRLIPGTQSHGEILIEVDGVVAAREIGNGIMNRILSGGDWLPGEEPILKVWDCIPLASVVTKGKDATPYRQRLAAMIQSINADLAVRNVALIDTRIIKSLAEGYAHYRELLKLGKEGVIISNPGAGWKDGTSKDKIKLKLEAECELEVIGFNEGENSNVGALGSFVCRTACGELVVNVSGRGDAQRAEVWANRDAWMGRIITVKANAIMAPDRAGDKHSLFLPIFMEERKDKSTADTLVRVREQFEAAVAAA